MVSCSFSPFCEFRLRIHVNAKIVNTVITATYAKFLPRHSPGICFVESRPLGKIKGMFLRQNRHFCPSVPLERLMVMVASLFITRPDCQEIVFRIVGRPQLFSSQRGRRPTTSHDCDGGVRAEFDPTAAQVFDRCIGIAIVCQSWAFCAISRTRIRLNVEARAKKF